MPSWTSGSLAIIDRLAFATSKLDLIVTHSLTAHDGVRLAHLLEADRGGKQDKVSFGAHTTNEAAVHSSSGLSFFQYKNQISIVSGRSKFKNLKIRASSQRMTDADAIVV